MMADMGCSSGPNALLVVSKIIDVIDEACRSKNHHCSQIGVFLNDLPGNDFNTLFSLLPSFNQAVEEAKGSNIRPCFVSGIPKSFYGRVFPDKFLHFVHSSYSVHWLSQVPRGLVSENGEPLNKGNIYISITSPREISKEYYAQFKRDFTLFLRSRSREMVPGGQMVLIFQGSYNTEDSNSILELLGSTLNDMVSKFYVADGELSCMMDQRSTDMGLGLPFNIASYALFTSMVAHVCNLLPGDFIHDVGDAHVYRNHIEPLQEQLKNQPKPFPVLEINSQNKEIDSFKAADFKLIGYYPHPKIEMKMAV